MATPSTTSPRCPQIPRPGRLLLHAARLVLLLAPFACGQASVPLLLPSGLAYDAQGNLYFSETANHLVRKLTPAGVLSIAAGTGTQGFAGDGGPATNARFDSPGAIAVDASGELFLADTHNHRIRRVDLASGVVTTIAGTGSPGLTADGLAAASTAIDFPSALAFDTAQNLYFADARTHVVRRIDHTSGLVQTIAGSGLQGALGDGGPARLAALDTPSGLTLDSAGNLYLSDAHNHRIRRVDALTGIISTIAGTGVAGFSSGQASASALRLPRGLAADPAGNLYIVDAGNHRLRRVDAATGQITTIAGSPGEGFAGDGAAASLALLDTPRAVTLSPAGLPTLADTENARIRQVDSVATIHTIAGLGAQTTVAGGLVLTGPASAVYGATGLLTATVQGAPVSGPVTFLDGTNPIGLVGLSSNLATLGTSGLSAGTHILTANFAALQSNTLTLTIAQAPALAAPTAVTTVYGLAPPGLTGTLTGVLPQDAGTVLASFTSAATQGSPAGAYPITATLTGLSSGNYALAITPAAVTVAPAPSTLSLSPALLAHIATTTAGQPGGKVTLLDGNANVATLSADASGDAQFTSAGFSNGTHTLSASYAGDPNFLPSTSAPVVVTIGPASGADFSLAPTGLAALSVPAGSSAVFSFATIPINGGLSSPILLAASGLPAGATATFSPSYIPPGATPASFTLTIQTARRAALVQPGALLFAAALALLLLPRRRRFVLSALALTALTGCGDRVNTAGQSISQSATYNVTVTATATSNTGSTLLHTATVTLTTQ